MSEPPKFDVVALRAALRDADETVVLQAYQRVFAGEAGRLVLAHHLMSCGVGNPIIASTDAELREAVGRHNAAIDLASKASFDQAAIAAAVLTGSLEETEHEDPALAHGYIPDENDEFD